MLDHIPFHIQVEIIKSLPVKQLLQFRSVSKTWKSFIDSSEFIAAHSVRHAHSHHLLVRYQDPGETEQNYVSIVDDHTFPQQRFDLTSPLFVDLFYQLEIIGCSHGLLCLYGYYRDHSDYCNMAIVWNPSIRKSVGIYVPHVLSHPYGTVLGFGVCPATSDPKLVKINSLWCEMEDITSIPIPWHVEVFTLSLGAWRSSCSNLPRKSIDFTWFQATIDGFIYWLAFDRIISNDKYRCIHLIMSFDLTDNEFREINLPVRLAQKVCTTLTISKLRESLAVLDYGIDTGIQVCNVWVMEHGVLNSFTKLFSIKLPRDSFTRVEGFRKSGEAIAIIQEDYEDDNLPATLAVFEPNSGRFSDLEIYEEEDSICVNSYMETLLLLDKPNGALYFDWDRR